MNDDDTNTERDTDAGRIERESSPSCGYGGVLRAMHAEHGNAVEPPAETDDDPEEIDVSALRVSDDSDAVDGQTAHREVRA